MLSSIRYVGALALAWRRGSMYNARVYMYARVRLVPPNIYTYPQPHSIRLVYFYYPTSVRLGLPCGRMPPPPSHTHIPTYPYPVLLLLRILPTFQIGLGLSFSFFLMTDLSS